MEEQQKTAEFQLDKNIHETPIVTKNVGKNVSNCLETADTGQKSIFVKEVTKSKWNETKDIN